MTVDASDPAALGVFRRLAPLVDAAEPCQSPEYVIRTAAVAGRRAHVVSTPGGDAAACVTVRAIGPFRQVILPPFTPYSAIFSTPSSAETLAATLEDRFDETILHLAPGDVFLDAATARGWRVAWLETYVMDPAVARDPSTWSQSASRNFRRSVGTHHVALEPDGAGVIASLCAAGYVRSGHRPPLPPDRFDRLADSIVGAGMGRPWICRNGDGVPVAGVVTLETGRSSSYWMAGGLPGDGMTVLLGSLFSRLADEGVRHFDFVGANTPSIAEFKRRFGPQLVRYPVVRHTRSRWIAFARAMRSRVRGGGP